MMSGNPFIIVQVVLISRPLSSLYVYKVTIEPDILIEINNNTNCKDIINYPRCNRNMYYFYVPGPLENIANENSVKYNNDNHEFFA